MVEIREVSARRDVLRFIRFPVELYRGCPCYTPPLESDELDNLLRSRNAAYDYCDTKLFMAYRDGKPVGRICALHNRLANQMWDRSCLRFTRFDFIDDPEVSAALMGAVRAWARELGLTGLQGPIGFCDLDYEGMLVEGFDRMNMFITVYSAPYYARHMEAMGFVKDADWVERRFPVPQQLDPKYARVGEYILKRKKLRRLELKRMKDIDPYVERIFGLINICYARLYGVVPLSEAMIRQYRDRFFGFLNPDYVSVILSEQDEVVGFGVAIPSLAEASRRCRGRMFPLGWLHLLRALRRSDTLELLLVAIHPDYQKLGLNGVMIHSIYERARANGIRWVETGPTLETNHAIQAEWHSFADTPHKRRRCYIGSLDG